MAQRPSRFQQSGTVGQLDPHPRSVGLDLKPPAPDDRPVNPPVSGRLARGEGTLVYPMPEEPSHDGPEPDEEPGRYTVTRSGAPDRGVG